MATLPPLRSPAIRFSAPTVHGAGRGRRLRVPTINLDIAHAPAELSHGVYACWVQINGVRYGASMHFGPRPVFKDSVALEVHVLDSVVEHFPSTVDVEVLAQLRPVKNFPDAAALQRAIADDIRQTRGILQLCQPER